MKSVSIAALFLSLLLAPPSIRGTDLPPGYWPEARSQPILDRTETIRLAPDLSALSPGEQEAVTHLIAVGRIMQDLYEIARHHQALEAERKLRDVHERTGKTRATANLLDLYRLNQGPIATTLDNKRAAFLPVDPQAPGKNVYPWGISKSEIEAFLEKHPEQRAQMLAERTVISRAVPPELNAHLGALRKYPALDTLHPGLRARLESLLSSSDPQTLYAVPYAVAYADRLHEAHGLLNRAAAAIESSDSEFAGYLRNRARDLLTNDYESGDASWVTGDFNRLNAQVGAYETYDDALYGAKAFHSLSLLLRNDEATAELKKALGSLQQIENALPYEQKKRVRDDIPVGVYEVIADFGQARGTNTATILPNDPLHARRYGRTILMRENILRHPAIFAGQQNSWKAAVADAFEADLDPSGNFYRTLWHEVGHYLGVDRDRKGRTLDLALEDYADSIEEMKADLVSLFALHHLARKDLIDGQRLRTIQASGILRTLQNNQPRTDQPYQRMQLVQFNYFLENGLLSFDPKTTTLSIDYSRYPEVVQSLLKRVLELQHQGDVGAAAAFYDRYTTWKPELHEALATKIREAQRARFRLVRYGALGE